MVEASQRRGAGSAPMPAGHSRFSLMLAAIIVLLGACLPMLGLSLVFVLLIEKVILRRVPETQRWLGLRPA